MRKVRLHEAAIQEALAERARCEAALDNAKHELAKAIDAAIDDSVATKDITAWVGVTRQMVGKMLRRDLNLHGSSNGHPVKTKPPAPRKRPGAPGRG